MSKNARDLVRFVNAVLERIRTGGEWKQLYAHYIGTRIQPRIPGPPAPSTPAARSGLTTLDTGIPEYTMLIGQARAGSRDGLPVGASYLLEASYLMRSRLLPAAEGLYNPWSGRRSPRSVRTPMRA